MWLWGAKGAHPGLYNRIISDKLTIGDLFTNGIDVITGLDADDTGKQFVGRGGSTIFYFNDVLRLHGSHTFANLGGEGSVVRHPTQDLAFAPTNDRSVLVLETAGHYQVRAELPLVESLVGPLTLSLPRSGDPADLVVRLHGVTESGNVVTLPVWQRAIQ